MYSDYKNKMFLDKFFEKHKVFSCKNLDYDLGNDNARTRIKYLFSKYGFFNYTLKENAQLAVSSHHNPYIQKGDNPNLHNQEHQQYIIPLSYLNLVVQQSYHIYFLLNTFFEMYKIALD